MIRQQHRTPLDVKRAIETGVDCSFKTNLCFNCTNDFGRHQCTTEAHARIPLEHKLIANLWFYAKILFDHNGNRAGDVHAWAVRNGRPCGCFTSPSGIMCGPRTATKHGLGIAKGMVISVLEMQDAQTIEAYRWCSEVLRLSWPKRDEPVARWMRGWKPSETAQH